jgi:hypothetical protein
MATILNIALFGAALLAYSVTATVHAYRQMRYPKAYVMGLLLLGDIALSAAAAAAIVTYLL